MNDDAMYVIDLLNIQRDVLRKALTDKQIRRDKFDRFSYSAWVIEETLETIAQYGSKQYISVGVIRELLKEQARDYDKYCKSNKDNTIRYQSAVDMTEYLLQLTGGFINESE